MPNPSACKAAHQERQQADGMSFLLPVQIADAALLLRHLFLSDVRLDTDGREIGSLQTAQSVAKYVACEIAQSRLLELPNAASENIQVELKDEHRQSVLTVTVSIRVDHEAPMPPLRM